jgi:hypothetical protein
MNDHPVLQVRVIRRLLCAKTYKRLLTYGAQFLDAMDQLAGKAVFRYAERKAFREMNQDEVAKQLKQLGYEYFRKATDCGPKELATFLAEKIKEGANSDDGTFALLTLLILSSD